MKGVRPYFCTPKKGRDDLVAQLVEHNTFNVGVLGSSPSGITENPPVHRGISCFTKALPSFSALHLFQSLAVQDVSCS